jgi:ribosomal protein L24
VDAGKDELKRDVGWTEMHLMPKICVDDTVDIVSGKYAGRRATVVKITEKMVVVRIDGLENEVRVLQSSVRRGPARKNEHVVLKNTEQLTPEEKTQVVKLATEELKMLRRRVDELVDVLSKLEL